MPIAEIFTGTHASRHSVSILDSCHSSFGFFLKIETNFPRLEASRGGKLEVCFEDMAEEFPFGLLVPKK